MLHWTKNKKHWIVVSLMVGAVGCAKVEIPRMRDITRSDASVGGQKGQAGGTTTRSAQTADDSELNLAPGSCDALNGASAVPMRTRAEFAGLRNMILQLNPAIASAELDAAVLPALERTNQSVIQKLEGCGTDGEQKARFQQMAEVFKARRLKALQRNPEPRSTTDFLRFMSLVFNKADGTDMSNAYLDMFYTEYVRAVDPFATIVFGSSNARADETTVGRSLRSYMPADLAQAPVTQRLGRDSSVLWVTLTEWHSGPAVDSALGELERASASREVGAVVLDLRFASGSEMPVLARMRDSVNRPNGWGALPIFVIVGRETSGTAAVFTYELQSRANARIHGTARSTYGYGKRLAQASGMLASPSRYGGLKGVILTIGAQPVSPEGEVGGKSYQYDLLESQVQKQFSADAILSLAMEASASAPGRDAPPVETAPSQPAEPPVQPEAQPMPQSEATTYVNPDQQQLVPAQISPEAQAQEQEALAAQQAALPPEQRAEQQAYDNGQAAAAAQEGGLGAYDERAGMPARAFGP